MARGVGDTEMLIMAVVKGVVCVILVGVVGYSIVTEVSVDADLLKVVLLLLASYFGYSAKMYHRSSNSGRGKGGVG